MLNAFEKGYLSLLKRFLFLSIFRLYFIKVFREINMEKVLQEFSLVLILFNLYQNMFGCATALFKEQISPPKSPTVDCSEGAVGDVL